MKKLLSFLVTVAVVFVLLGTGVGVAVSVNEVRSEIRADSSVSQEFLQGVSDENKKFIKNIKHVRIKRPDSNKDTSTNINEVGKELRRVGNVVRALDTKDTRTNINEVGKELRRVGNVVRALDTKAEELKLKVQKAVSKDMKSVLRRVSRSVQKADKSILSTATSTEKIVNKFIRVKREEKLQKITGILDRKEGQINKYVDIVVDSSARGEADTRALDAVLFSSISDVETLIFDETGVRIDLSANKRRIVREVKRDVEEFERQVEALNLRSGLDMYRDTDNDGVSDYDEVNIYFTDPRNAFTSGSPLTDGERIMFGFDVHSTSTEQVIIESPEVAGAVSDIFEVNEIAKTANDALIFEGKALPNSFVTLYIFSTPVVVTVKAGDNGKWEYTLDKQLEDGEHVLYVALVNNSGKILAKSPRVPFTKTVEAVNFNQLQTTVVEPTPLEVLQDNVFVVALLLFAVFVTIVVLTLGSWRVRSLV